MNITSEFSVNEVIQYSDLSPWEDATVLDYSPEYKEYLIKFHSDNETMWAPGSFLRKKN